MKIAIVAPSPVPFVIGGAEKLFWGLLRHLNELPGCEAELIKITCRDQEFWPLMEGYDRARRLDLSYFDLIISTKYPAWMVSHPNHHLYLQHTCRGVYDLYHLSGLPEECDLDHPALSGLREFLLHPRPDRSLLDGFFAELFSLRHCRDLPADAFLYPGPLTRAVIRWLDRVALAPDQIRSYSAISRNVATREGYFPPGAEVAVVHHPSDLTDFRCTGYDYLFTASRLEGLKRLDLLIEAFRLVRADIEFRIAGTGGQEQELRRLAAGDERIRFLGFVPDAQLVAQYAGALFVPYAPYDEDYGLITVEAMRSAKAVVTTFDAGGVTELVADGVTGRVVAPTPEALAAAMEGLIADRGAAVRLGEAGRLAASHIDWPRTIAVILRDYAPWSAAAASSLSASGPAPARGAKTPKPAGSGAAPAGRQQEGAPGPAVLTARPRKVVGTTTYQLHPPTGGGKARVYHLFRELGRRAACVFVALSANRVPLRRTREAGFTEISVGRTEAEITRLAELEARLSVKAVEDLAALEGFRLNDLYVKTLAAECADADLVVLSHPYLHAAVREVYKGRLWYEAQNVEYDLKAAILPPSPEREQWLEAVRRAERACLLDAELTIAVSDEDRARFVELYGAPAERIVVVRNGADFRAAAGRRPAPPERRRLKERLGLAAAPVALFLGSYHGPNCEAAAALAEMAPACPEVLFAVAGSVCDHWAGGATPPNFLLLGSLDEDEKEVLLSAADLGLNPVVSGSGSNLKLLEYVAYDLPVLTTPFGNRGYGLKDGEHLLMAEIEDFPGRIREALCGDGAALAEMAARARRFAAARYDWTVLAAPLLPLL